MYLYYGIWYWDNNIIKIGSIICIYNYIFLKIIFVFLIFKSYIIVMIKVCVLNIKEIKIEILKLFK